MKTYDIPQHWQIVNLRQILRPFSEKNHPKLPLLSVVREKGVIIRNTESKEENHNYIPEDLSGYKRVKIGQFAMNKMKAWQGSYGISKYNGIVSPAYFVFDVIEKVNLDFFNFAIRSKVYVNYFGRASDGIRVGQWDLSINRMKDIPFFLPPRDEQDQIVRFLDWKVSEINRLINAKHQQIERLEELKKTVVSRVVTRGLNADVKMKDSGVNWIGDIPEHWEVLKLKRVTSLSNEKTSKQDAIYIGMENVLSWKGSYDLNNQINPESVCSVFSKGNILFGKLRPYLAKCIISDFDGICSSEFLVLKNINCNKKYLLHYLLNPQFIDIVNSSTYGAKMPRANWNFIGNQSVTIPPIEEQQQIATYLDEQMQKIEVAIANKQKQIETLQELKTRLISDVVTGKIDVRGVEIPDYEYVEEESDMENSDVEDEASDEVSGQY